MKKRNPLQPDICLCGNQKPFSDCCNPYLDGDARAPDAEVLMRSRYTAYVLQREDYLLATWHASTRPTALHLRSEAQPQWLGLTVKRHEPAGMAHALVEFVARYKVGGRAHRLHEVSRFIREDGVWFYVDGDMTEGK